ncbi:FxSxx-COOH cyclophane-containing RiPP peptide [Streptomyces sp. E11-3]|uniref:FxSxx-COOH cyclophane-containing RiPP peptide n=1 Tax=Streptomyces sp. E11-3 TaxID=3110112 RepID=UPI00397EF9B7
MATSEWDEGLSEPPEPTNLPEPPDLPDLPDLLDLDLEQLRTLDHPVLAEVLADLRERAGQPSETLWGFNNSF